MREAGRVKPAGLFDDMTVYCTQADIDRLFSAAGRLAFSDHDEDDVSDPGVVDDCIDQASQEIELYCFGRYDAAGLSSSTLVTRWCTVLAVHYLCERRGNPVPETVLIERDRLLGDGGLLFKIQAGRMQLPGVPLRTDLRPAWSNLKVDRRYPTSKVRVRRQNSSDVPTTLTKDQALEIVTGDY